MMNTEHISEALVFYSNRDALIAADDFSSAFIFSEHFLINRLFWWNA
jgi:hypothetical protein